MSGNHQSAKNLIESELKDWEIDATPQAQNAIAQCILHAPSEITGDSDSLLLGLLRSGSYSVDALELSGVNPRRLAMLAEESLAAPLAPSNEDGHATFFETCAASGALLEFSKLKGTLETADILRHAVAPVSLGDFYNVDLTSCTLDDSIRVLILDCLRELFINELCPMEKHPDRKFQDREHSLNEKESRQIKSHFQEWYGEERQQFGDFAVLALNEWFVRRNVLTQPTELVGLFIEVCQSELEFGAELFTSNGGNYDILENSLQVASRLNPERDASGIVLCCRNNRIFAGEYTYRNSMEVETRESESHGWQRLGIQAIRPIPLVSQTALTGFEHVLSSESTTENDIQRFLSQHPEIITSFGGYSNAHPHVLLREDGRNDMIPDYLLELPLSRTFDIVDLKLPTARLTARQPYIRISAELQKAVAQLRAYQNFFDSSDNMKWFSKKYGLEPYRPEVVVVMGRDAEFSSRAERLEIENQLSPTKLVTYDDLMAYARSRMIDPSSPRNLG